VHATATRSRTLQQAACHQKTLVIVDTYEKQRSLFRYGYAEQQAIIADAPNFFCAIPGAAACGEKFAVFNLAPNLLDLAS
jgi:hypothetical protein